MNTEHTAPEHDFNAQAKPTTTTEKALTSLAFGFGLAVTYVGIRILAVRLADAING